MHGVLRNAGQMHSKCVYGMCYLSQNYKIVIMHLFEFLFHLLIYIVRTAKCIVCMCSFTLWKNRLPNREIKQFFSIIYNSIRRTQLYIIYIQKKQKVKECLDKKQKNNNIRLLVIPQM